MKKQKVMKIEVPKGETPNTTEGIVLALEGLLASNGWAIVKGILNDNIAYLEKAILDKVDPISGGGLGDDVVEILRIKRNLNIDLRDTPENYIKEVIDKREIPDEFDPYYKQTKDIPQR